MKNENLKTLLKILGVIIALYMFLVGIKGLSSSRASFKHRKSGVNIVPRIATSTWGVGGVLNPNRR